MLTSLQMRKQQVVRDAIQDAAIGLFEERGFDHTTVDEIADRAGVSRRSLFRYFSSKSDLMAEEATRHGHELVAAIEACEAGLPVREVFRTAVRSVARETAGRARAARLMRVAAQCPAARSAQLSRMGEVQDAVAAAYARRTGVDLAAAGILAGLTLSVLAVVFRCWLQQGEPEPGELVERILETAEEVLGGKTVAGTRRR